MYSHKKNSTNKFSLFTGWQTEILSLAATAATTTTFAFSTTAVAQNVQFVHGFHLLSYRSLSINCVKKLEAARACSPILLVNDIDQLLGGGGFRGKFDHQLPAAHHDIFLV
jgi:hypothetical protein